MIKKKTNHIGKYSYSIECILFYYSNFLLPMLTKNCIFFYLPSIKISSSLSIFLYSLRLFFNISTKNYEIPMEKNFRNNFLLFQIYLFLNCVSQDTSDLSVIWNLKSLVVDRPCTWQLFSTFYVERPHCPSLTIVYSK